MGGWLGGYPWMMMNTQASVQCSEQENKDVAFQVSVTRMWAAMCALYYCIF